MDKDRKEILLRVTSGVLERFAFMFAEEPDDEDDEWRGECIRAAITYNGSVDGELALAAPEPFCREIAANVMGEDADELSEEVINDAVRELTNIICGEFVAALHGEVEVVDLTVPVLYRIDRTRWRELAAETESVLLFAEEQRIMVGLIESE